MNELRVGSVLTNKQLDLHLHVLDIWVNRATGEAVLRIAVYPTFPQPIFKLTSRNILPSDIVNLSPEELCDQFKEWTMLEI